MTVISIVLQSFLAAYFVFSGSVKVMGAEYWADIFDNLKLPEWFRIVTGIVQFIGATIRMIGYWYEWMVALTGIWLGITMLLACFAHLGVKDSFGKIAPDILFFD